MPHTESAWGWAGPERTDVRVTNRCGATVAVGDIVLLDHGQADAASTTNAPGLPTAGVANIINPATAYLAHGIFGVVLRGALDDQPTVVRLKGYCDNVSMLAATTLDDKIVARNGARTGAIGAGATDPNSKVLFIPLTVTGGAGLTDGWFNGIEGFGQIIDQ